MSAAAAPPAANYASRAIAPEIRAKRQGNQEVNALLATVAELTALGGSLRGRPVIVAGAGPSLRAAIPALRALDGRVPIVAVDRAFPRLQNQGIRPRLVVVTDDQDEVQDFFRGRDLSQTLLIANTTANAPACRMFKNRVFFRVKREQGGGPPPYPGEAERWPKTAQLCITLGYVGNEAVQVADHLGGRPIVLVGFDLAGAPGMDALHLYLRDLWLPLARHADPRIQVWNASPGSAWTEKVRTVDPADLVRLLEPHIKKGTPEGPAAPAAD